MRLRALVWLALLSLPAAANPPAAVLDQPTLPVPGEAATLLHVQTPGRFSLGAHSGSGVALQLVDMLEGPGEISGAAGAEDGRIDTLLDAGTYKLRAFGTGTVALSAAAFRDAAPPAPAPPPGTLFSAELADLQQRSFWLAVPGPGAVRISAAGRALADLVLWRNGRDLTPVTLATRMVEPERGHPLTEIAIDEVVEPGTYLVTAYGGKPATWGDGAGANPFFLRAGLSDALQAGFVSGTIGGSGTELFALPKGFGAIRLDLPQPASAELSTDTATAEIASKSREPSAVLRLDAKSDYLRLRGSAGQAYALRAIQTSQKLPDGPGSYFVTASTLGVGGDEVPPTMLLALYDPPAKPRILGSTVPQVGGGDAWHARFNLRGATKLLLQPAGGQLVVHTGGVQLAERLDSNGFFDVPGGLLDVLLAPKAGAQGALDLTIGPPDVKPRAAAPWPADPVIPFGVQTLWPRQSFILEGQQAPGAETWLVARKIPVELADGPLVVTQMPGQALTLPVKLPDGATLGASIAGSAEAPRIARTSRSDGGEDLALAAPPAARTLVFFARPPPPPAPAAAVPEPPEARPALATGMPAYFNLGEKATTSFALHVAQGGGFQIETLGRLHTSGTIGTHFIAKIGDAEANGAGQNMRLAGWLRAGDYILRVAVQDSFGHLGVLATPAPLLETPVLRAGGSVRDTVQAGTGRRVPIEVAQDGTYRVTLLSQGEGFISRIVDAEGWPLVADSRAEEPLKLRAGKYALFIKPGETERRLVASMDRIVATAPITGHGPHPLTLGEDISATWREPPVGDAKRTPDQFTFSLAGAAHASVDLSDGMVGSLVGPGAPRRISGHFEGVLAAGDWRLDLVAEGRNDRLDYTVKVDTEEIEPGIARRVALGDATKFTLAAARVVTLATTGPTPTRCVVRSADGGELFRAGARENDWNTAFSHRLPAGSYSVEILASKPPTVQTIARPDAEPDTLGSAGQADEPAPQDGSGGKGDAPLPVLHFDLPADLPAVAAPAALAVLGGEGVHVLSIPRPAEHALILASAHGTGTIVVALERQGADGSWQTVAQGVGAHALAAAMADGAARPWRAAIWSFEDDGAPITAAVRAMASAGAELARPHGLDVAVARLDLTTPVMFDVTGPAGLMQAGAPGRAAREVAGGHVLPQGKVVWLLAPEAGKLDRQAAGAARFSLDLPTGAQAVLPGGAAAAGRLRVWRAEGGDGQPAFSDGNDGGAVAPFSAVMREGGGTVLHNAGTETLRAQLELHDLAVLPQAVIGAGMSARLKPGTALPVATGGGADVQISLEPGLAAFVAGTGVWAPAAALTRTLAAADRIWIANLGTAPAVAGLLPVPHVGADALRAGMVQKRFFGAAGSFELAAEIAPGARVAVAGEASLMVRDAAGAVVQGRDASPSAGPARVAITHGRGLVVVWQEAPGKPVWPAGGGVVDAAPGTYALGGAAMALRVGGQGPVLLHVTSTSPVLMGLRGERPDLFPAGAAFHRVVAGPAVLQVISPQDGPLSGTLSLSTEAPGTLAEGLGESVAVAPGGAAAFAFVLKTKATIGVGVRAEPDSAQVRVLGADGAVLGEGVAELLRDMQPGRYVMEVRVPPDAPTSVVRPALFGTAPRASGPPAEILAGFRRQGSP